MTNGHTNFYNSQTFSKSTNLYSISSVFLNYYIFKYNSGYILALSTINYSLDYKPHFQSIKQFNGKFNEKKIFFRK